MTQVAGRAGRSQLGGRVVMQTFMPENPLIQMAGRHDFEAFYSWEIANRRRLGYPPLAQVLRLEIRHSENSEAERQARAMAERLNQVIAEENRTETSLVGPVPCFFARLNGLYRWQIVVRGPDPASLLRGRVPANVRLEMEPQSLL